MEVCPYLEKSLLFNKQNEEKKILYITKRHMSHKSFKQTHGAIKTLFLKDFHNDTKPDLHI